MSCEKCSAAAEHLELISGVTYLEKIWLSPLFIRHGCPRFSDLGFSVTSNQRQCCYGKTEDKQMSCEKCSAAAAEHLELISGSTYLEKIWLS